MTACGHGSHKREYDRAAHVAVAVTTAMEISASEVQYNTREDNTRQYEIDCAEGAGRGAGGGGAGAGVNPRGAHNYN